MSVAGCEFLHRVCSSSRVLPTVQELVALLFAMAIIFVKARLVEKECDNACLVCHAFGQAVGRELVQVGSSMQSCCCLLTYCCLPIAYHINIATHFLRPVDMRCAFDRLCGRAAAAV